MFVSLQSIIFLVLIASNFPAATLYSCVMFIYICILSTGFYYFENSCVHLFCHCFISYSLHLVTPKYSVFMIVRKEASLAREKMPGRTKRTKTNVDDHVLLCIQGFAFTTWNTVIVHTCCVC